MSEATIFYPGPIVTLDQARNSLSTRYFTGKPCKHGHIAQRDTKTCRCVICIVENSRAYSLKHPDRVMENKKRFQAANRDLCNERNREYKSRHPDKVAQARRDYYQKNKIWIAAKSGSYPSCSKERRATRTRNRNARIKGVGGTHCEKEIANLLAKQKGRCGNCSRNLNGIFHADHKMPVALGGSNDISNIEILCPPCNQRKSAKHPIRWARENGRLL